MQILKRIKHTTDLITYFFLFCLVVLIDSIALYVSFKRNTCYIIAQYKYRAFIKLIFTHSDHLNKIWMSK